MKVRNKMKKNDIIKLTITDASIEGNGIGRVNGQVIFVPRAVPGDVLLVRIVKIKSTYSYGKIEEILIPSEDRTQTGCSVYNRCGGCVFRHMTYECELKIKHRHVLDCIERIGGFNNIESLPIIGASQLECYRNKAQFPVRYDSCGNIVIGFFNTHSHIPVDCTECRLHPRIFNLIIVTIKQWMTLYKISPYDETKHKGLIRHIFIRSSGDQSEVAVCIVINGTTLPYSDLLIRHLTEVSDEIKSITINFNTQKTNVILGKESKVIWGNPYIKDNLCGLKFYISDQSFYQVNHDQTEVLYSLAYEMLNPSPEDTVLDLYCGIGTIGLSMSSHIKSLYGVEIVGQAVSDAKNNAALNGINNASFEKGDSAYIAKRLLSQGIKADYIIIDPPRKGCGEEAIHNIVEAGPKKVLYISCNAATLARDIKIFSSYGLTPVKIAAVDLFPRTGHVETVCLLSKLHADQGIEVEF